MPVELRELRSFCAAAKLRSISKGAEQLGIGQPTMTTHVKKLEDELGVQLFDRVKRPIQLTVAGQRLAELAAPLLDGIDNLVAMTAEAEAQGPVRLASTHEIIAHTLLRVVKSFVSQYPHVPLRITSGSKLDVLQLVEDGQVDFGVVPGPHRRVNLDFQGLFPYERVLITPKDHPLLHTPISSIDLLADWPLILLGHGSSSRAMLEEEFRRRGLTYELVVELDSTDTVKRCVALGLGISVVPRLALDPEDVGELGITSLATLLPVEQAGLVTLKGKAMPRSSENFINVVVETLASPSMQPLLLPA